MTVVDPPNNLVTKIYFFTHKIPDDAKFLFADLRAFKKMIFYINISYFFCNLRVLMIHHKPSIS